MNYKLVTDFLAANDLSRVSDLSENIREKVLEEYPAIIAGLIRQCLVPNPDTGALKFEMSMTTATQTIRESSNKLIEFYNSCKTDEQRLIAENITSEALAKLKRLPEEINISCRPEMNFRNLPRALTMLPKLKELTTRHCTFQELHTSALHVDCSFSPKLETLLVPNATNVICDFCPSLLNLNVKKGVKIEGKNEIALVDYHTHESQNPTLPPGNIEVKGGGKLSATSGPTFPCCTIS